MGKTYFALSTRKNLLIGVQSKRSFVGERQERARVSLVTLTRAGYQ
jgi:hypothetical protein